jgi:hypothetical protein
MKRFIRSFLLILIASASFQACVKDKPNSESDIVSFSIKNVQSTVEINKADHLINLTFPVNIITGEGRIAEFVLSDAATAKVNGVVQESGKTLNNFNQDVIYKVVAENQINTTDWTVSVSNTSYSLQWGLGRFLKSEHSNNRSYDWYIDQYNTGTYKDNNCGPTSCTMAAKWYRQSFSRTVEDARAMYRPEGGWWYTGDMTNYLTVNNIPNHYVTLGNSADATSQVLKSSIDAGNIAILCLDMYYIRKEANTAYHIDKFYNTSATGWGHFIVVKGYKQIDDKLYFEVYDPNSYNTKYKDLTLKGKDRYYRNTDIYSATSIWWNYAIEISTSGSLPKGAITDPATVPQAYGR